MTTLMEEFVQNLITCQMYAQISFMMRHVYAWAVASMEFTQDILRQ